MQKSHTDRGVSLCGVAKSCGIESAYEVTDRASLEDFARRVKGPSDRTLFARVAIHAEEPPRVLPSRDGVFLKNRFRRALGVE